MNFDKNDIFSQDPSQDLEDFQDLSFEDQGEEDFDKLYKRAYQYTIKLLAKKDYSVHKIKQKLRDKGYNSELSKKLIAELLEKNYLREDLYIEARIKGFLRKGYAANVILYRLSQEQCHTTAEHIENIMHEIGLNHQGQLKLMIEKKLHLDGEFVKDKEKLRQKVLRYCINRGYSISDASRVYGQVYDELFPS
ncbi:MAG: hypothetical protein CME63_00500 [Halobacteriovoraceae bacterium]|jgi:regulatory protein|nr:hypothetical protein [Halobacteriovoraceae bacterium]MBC96204.1 hypothetical protein [Halobacteriovoraceae bacterium]|tara:strand:- start:123000 stop:123578 length:579 start_codon:yes stop_codon:yes gene_type:complete